MSKLFGKYIIQKADGSPVDSDAQYFVLRLDTDSAARRAALRYASIISPDDPEFAEEIFQWVIRCERKAGSEPSND